MTAADIFGTICASALCAGAAFASDGAHQQMSWVHTSSTKGSKITMPAAERRTVTTKHGAWQVTCDEADDRSVCSAAFKVIDRNRNATILTWLLGLNTDGDLLAEFFVPTEVLIGPGVRLTVAGGQPYTADYVACGQAACKAILPISEAMAQELAGADQATIAVTSSQGRVTEFSMGIAGIDAALAALAP